MRPLYTKLSSIILAAALPGAALAEGFSFKDPRPSFFNYNYVEARYVDRDSNLDGFSVEGSNDVAQNINVLAGFAMLSTSGVDYSQLNIGVGYHFSLPNQPTTDAFFDAGLIRADNDVDDEIGLWMRGGVRHQAFDQLELQGAIAYEDVFDGDVTIEFGGLYKLSNQWHAGASYKLADDDTLNIRLRYYY